MVKIDVKNTVAIRDGSLNDTQQLANIEERCFDQKFRYGYSILNSMLEKRPKYISLVAQLSSSEKILGYCIGEQDDHDFEKGRVITIQVDPNYQRNRIGKLLLENLELELKTEYNVKRIELQVHFENKSAIEFYMANDYKIIRRLRNYYEKGDHAFLLEKKVKN